MSHLMKIPVAGKRRISSCELFWVSTLVSVHHNNCQKLSTLICSDTTMFVYLCLRDAKCNSHECTRKNWCFAFHLHQQGPVLPDPPVLTNGKQQGAMNLPFSIHWTEIGDRTISWQRNLQASSNVQPWTDPAEGAHPTTYSTALDSSDSVDHPSPCQIYTHFGRLSWHQEQMDTPAPEGRKQN